VAAAQSAAAAHSAKRGGGAQRDGGSSAVAAAVAAARHHFVGGSLVAARRWRKRLGCAFRLVFRFLPVLIFRNSGYSAEFPEFRATHVGIKSFQGKINLVWNSGLRNSGRNSGGILCHV
jgi:hypothetical protein